MDVNHNCTGSGAYRKDQKYNQYENMPMQYTTIFHGCKNDHFQLIFYYFHIFAQNIDCGYTLEPPQ